MDDSERTMSAVVATYRGWRSCFRPTEGPAQLLGESGLSLLRGQLARSHPITLAARDGLALHGYHTLPDGVQPRQLPLVLLVHGCPLSRDRWTTEPPPNARNYWEIWTPETGLGSRNHRQLALSPQIFGGSMRQQRCASIARWPTKFADSGSTTCRRSRRYGSKRHMSTP